MKPEKKINHTKESRKMKVKIKNNNKREKNFNWRVKLN
jgi:hypothetical protein